MKKWTKKEEDKAIALLEDGLSYRFIANELNRTSKSVKLKLNKLGLNFRQFNPTREIRNCLKCEKEFEVTNENPKKFCGHSCSAQYNNRLKIKKKYDNCLNCEKELKRKQSIYCSSDCHNEKRKKERNKKVENNDKNLSSSVYKKYLIDKHGEKCMECGWCEVNQYSGKIPVEIEHVDGNSENNSLDNLKLLCPNHHSLTPTYRALNYGNGRHSRRERCKDGKSY